MRLIDPSVFRELCLDKRGNLKLLRYAIQELCFYSSVFCRFSGLNVALQAEPALRHLYSLALFCLYSFPVFALLGSWYAEMEQHGGNGFLLCFLHPALCLGRGRDVSVAKPPYQQKGEE